MRTYSRPNAKRMTAFAFLLCFVIISLLSEAFVLTHANHQHDHYGAGGECAVCAQIQSIENQRRQLGAAAGNISTAWAGLFAAVIFLCFVFGFQFQTPVHLKTRLNN